MAPARDATLRSRPAGPLLRPFVRLLWASDETAAARTTTAPRERVLPAGTTHVVFRLSDHPLHLFDAPDDPIGRTLTHAVIGGPRAAAYVRDVSRPVRSVGAQLHACAAEVLLGAPAGELAGHHTSLGDAWGRGAIEARERLLEARTQGEQIDVLERILTERILASPRLDGGVARAVAIHAARRFEEGAGVARVVEESGYSHRRFIELFQREVGLPPKVYYRVWRLQRAITLAGAAGAPPWGQVALLAGYADQPHLCREMRELCGITPGEYREINGVRSLHVPLEAPRAAAGRGRSIFFKTGGAAEAHAPRVDSQGSAFAHPAAGA